MVNRVLSFIAFGLITAGIVGGVFTILELILSLNSSSLPESMTLSQLIARGPKGNPHVQVTHLSFCEHFVYLQKRNKTWQDAWIPISPLEEAGLDGPPPHEVVKAIVLSPSVRSQVDLDFLCKQESVTGMVANLDQVVGGRQRHMLDQKYPGTDWSSCIIIQHGRMPMNVQVLIFSLAMCAFLVLFGCAMAYVIVRSVWLSKVHVKATAGIDG